MSAVGRADVLRAIAAGLPVGEAAAAFGYRIAQADDGLDVSVRDPSADSARSDLRVSKLRQWCREVLRSLCPRFWPPDDLGAQGLRSQNLVAPRRLDLPPTPSHSWWSGLLALAAAALGYRAAPVHDSSGGTAQNVRSREAVGPPDDGATRPVIGKAWDRSAPTMPLWCLTEMTFPDPPTPARDVPVAQGLLPEDLSVPGSSWFHLPPTPSLTRWSRLWPQLARALGSTAPSRRVAVRRAVAKLAAGGAPPLPVVPRRGWASHGEIWVDRSRRLAPFWGDQDEVVRRLSERLPGGWSVRWVAGGDRLPAYRSGAVLVLGDLGVYGHPATRTRWSTRGTAGAPRVALMPVPAAAVGSTGGWAPIVWEQRRCPKVDLDEALAGLLTRLAPASVVPWGLVRAVRRECGCGDVAVEASLVSASDVSAADAYGFAWSRAAVPARQAAFRALDPDAQRRVGVCLRRWRSWGAGPPAGVVRAETLLWTALSDDHEAAPGDVADARAFAARLAGSSRTRPHPDVLAFGAALPTAVYAKYPELRRLWSWVWGDRVDVPVPDGYRRADLAAEIDPEPPPDRWWGLRQVGQRLVGHPMPDGAWPSAVEGPGSPVAWLLAAAPTATIDGVQRRLGGLDLPLDREQPIRVETDRCVATITPWRREGFDAAGQDRYGLWAEAKVRGKGGEARIRMRWIPPGRGVMGSPESELGRWQDDGPRHVVVFTRGFWLGETPVTQEQWFAVTGERPSRFQDGPDAPRRPVERVDWWECGRFADAVGARRPTEAEWEFACRAGTTAATWFGELGVADRESKVLADRAWYHPNSGHTTHPVGSVAANPLGLFDMLGNVYEWCDDEVSYGAPYGAVAVRVDPPAAIGGPDRVFRGGSWGSYARAVRAADRRASHPEDRGDLLGFRLARGPAPGQAGGRAEPDQGRTESDQGRAQTDPGPRSGPARSAKGRGAPRRREEEDP
jgi:formylglycine-generating enzyme required for sulfatase activity